MFDTANGKRLVSITAFRRGGEASYIQSHLEEKMTKKEMLKKVGEWWDNHGTGLDDYDGIQAMFLLEREENND